MESVAPLLTYKYYTTKHLEQNMIFDKLNLWTELQSQAYFNVTKTCDNIEQI